MFDIELLADKTIEKLAVSPGQVIWIWANVYSLDFVEALAFRIRARGAFWLLRLNSEPLLRRIGLGVPDEYLALVPEHEIRWLDDVDAIIEIKDHGSHLPDVPIERRRAMAAEWIALIDAAEHKGCRRIMVINPTPALAAACNLPLDEFQQRVQKAIDVDQAVINRQQESVGGKMRLAQNVRIQSPSGTDLSLKIGGRPVHLDTNSLPFGEAYIAPLESSAEGVAVIDKAFLRGQLIEYLALTFSGGRVVKATSPDSQKTQVFLELLAASSGDKEIIAELGIGVNPGVTEPIGNISLDEKIGGSVHIAIGMNEHFGGKNKSNLHLDLIILHPTVWVDDNLILENGAFME